MLVVTLFKMPFFRDMTPCRLVYRYQRLEGTCYFHLQGKHSSLASPEGEAVSETLLATYVIVCKATFTTRLESAMETSNLAVCLIYTGVLKALFNSLVGTDYCGVSAV